MDVVFDELLLLVDDDATRVAPSPPVVDSSCLLVRLIVMFIVTSGDGDIGTLYDLLIGMLYIMTVDTNAEHEYLSLLLYIMERSDYDVSEGASATEQQVMER